MMKTYIKPRTKWADLAEKGALLAAQSRIDQEGGIQLGKEFTDFEDDSQTPPRQDVWGD